MPPAYRLAVKPTTPDEPGADRSTPSVRRRQQAQGPIPDQPGNEPPSPPRGIAACSAEQVDIRLALLVATAGPGHGVRDLAAGTILLEADLLARAPHPSVAGVDSSAAILDLARQRLHPLAGASRGSSATFRPATGSTCRRPRRPSRCGRRRICRMRPSAPPSRSRAVTCARALPPAARPHGDRPFRPRLRPAHGAMWARTAAQAAAKSGWSRDPCRAGQETGATTPLGPTTWSCG